jgi:hypothetical protein
VLKTATACSGLQRPADARVCRQGLDPRADSNVLAVSIPNQRFANIICTYLLDFVRPTPATCCLFPGHRCISHLPIDSAMKVEAPTPTGSKIAVGWRILSDVPAGERPAVARDRRDRFQPALDRLGTPILHLMQPPPRPPTKLLQPLSLLGIARIRPWAGFCNPIAPTLDLNDGAALYALESDRDRAIVRPAAVWAGGHVLSTEDEPRQVVSQRDRTCRNLES